MYNPRLSNNSSRAKTETAQKTPAGIVDNYPENDPKMAKNRIIITF